MSYTIITPGDGSSLDPMKLLQQYTILQTALLSLFPFGSPGYQIIQASRPGEELATFHSIFKSTTKPIPLKNEYGARVLVKTLTPDPDIQSMLVFALSTAYEKAAKYDLSIKEELTKLYYDHPKPVVIVQPTSVESFVYDGVIIGGKRRLRKTRFFIFDRALTIAAKNVVVDAEIESFSPMTPIQIQKDIIQALEKELNILPEKTESGWKFQFGKDVDIHTYIPIAFQTNQGFLRATHPGMILPETSPFPLVKQLQNVGEIISNVSAPLLPESKEVEETPPEDIPEITIGSVPIIRNRDATGFSMVSQYAIGTFIPELLPTL